MAQEEVVRHQTPNRKFLERSGDSMDLANSSKTTEIVRLAGDRKFAFDLLLLGAFLFFANLPLVAGNFFSELIFFPSEVMRGQWWRIVTHPFAHLTFYHFALDAGAFWLLYTGLSEKRVAVKLLYTFFCGAVSLGTVLLFCPEIQIQGLCGLSGVAHGLMVVSALEMMTSGKNFHWGLASFAVVFLKSLYEAMTGEVFFAALHLGLCGNPLAVCHLGGVIGGLGSYFGIKCLRKLSRHLKPGIVKLKSSIKFKRPMKTE
jgi:rhomboid family GlyGly-CTERM serine protease